MSLPGVSVAIGNDPKNLLLATGVIRVLCEFVGLSGRETALVEIAVAEAVSNAMLHACADQPDAEIWLVARCEPGVMEIERRETGIPIPALPENPKMPDPLAETGRGWPLIYSGVDKVAFRIEDGVNILTLTKRLPA